MSVVTDDLGKMHRDVIEYWENAEAAAFDTGVKQGLGEVNDLALSFGSSCMTTSPSDWRFTGRVSDYWIYDGSHDISLEDCPRPIPINPESIISTFPIEPKPTRCPYCNIRYLPEDRLCVGCGAPL